MIFKQYAVILEKTSSMIEEESLEGRLELKRVWDIFGEEERGDWNWREGGAVREGGENKRKSWRVGMRLKIKGDSDLEKEGRGEKEKEKEKEKREEGRDLIGRGEKGGKRREDIWSGVYFGLRKEVWVGTSEGWVWRKGDKLEKRKIDGGVRAMAVVGNQVF